jgi:beta-mannosidase
LCLSKAKGMMINVKTISLNGKWNLYFNMECGNMPLTIKEVKEQKWRRIDAIVPGNVELDLQKAGIEEDAFYGENLYNFRKYEFYQWWFEREFVVPRDFEGKDILLRLKGLNTFGTIWVNGEIVGETSNMLIEHELNINKSVNIGGKNHIAIRIKSPINAIRNKEFPVNITSAGHIDEMVWLRMPPHSFGWDIAPRLLSAGIWRDIEIVAMEKTYIKEVYYATRSLTEDKAELLVKYRFQTDKCTLDNFSVRIKGICEDSTIDGTFQTKFCSDEAVLEIPNPKLWWPKGYGMQYLYDMEFQLLYNEEVMDTHYDRIGIRFFEIETEYNSGVDNEFKIWINGMPIMAKGTNWVPLDALHSRDKERLITAHDLLDDLGCNIALLDSLHACAVLRKYDGAISKMQEVSEILDQMRH